MKKLLIILVVIFSSPSFSQVSSGCGSINWQKNLVAGGTYTFSVPPGSGSGWNYRWVVSPSSKLQILSGANQNSVQIKVPTTAEGNANIYVTRYKNGYSACADKMTVIISKNCLGGGCNNTCRFTLDVANCSRGSGLVARQAIDPNSNTSSCERNIIKEEWRVYGGSFEVNNSNYFSYNGIVGDLWVMGNPGAQTTVKVKLTYIDGSIVTFQNTFDIYNGSSCYNNGLPGLSVYPNPINESSTINLKLNKKSPVSLSVKDLEGNLIHSIKNNQVLNKGNYKFELNDIIKMNKGIYIIELSVDGKTIERKKVIK